MIDNEPAGLAFLKAHVAGPERASIFSTMSMGEVVLEAGHVVIHARADERHLNPLGGVHGGFAATLLDSVTGCAVHTMLEAGVTFATIDLAVKMLLPIPQGDEVIGEARVSHLSRSLGVADGTIRDGAGRLLATGSATCFIKRPARAG